MVPEKSGKPVAGYFRVSRARDGMKAPELYQDEIERFCAYKGVNLAHTFSDVDFSGRRGAKRRPGLEELLERRREFSAVVIPKLSRFGRSVSDLAKLFDTFDRDGIGLVFLDLNIDTSTSQGRLLRNVMASFAEYESDVRSDYSRAAHDYLRRNGRPNGGQVPYGYRLEAGNYIIVKRQAKVVREIFTRYVGGDSATAIAKDLTVRGVEGTRSAQWQMQTVVAMIENSAYVARRRYEGELLPGAWPPIIDDDLWKRAQETRATVKLPPGTPPRAGKGLYLLSGLAVCGLCGRNLHHTPDKKRRPAMYCCQGGRDFSASIEPCDGGGIAAARADKMVADAFLERVASPFAREALKAPRSLFPSARDSDDAQARLADLDRRMARLIDLLVDAGPVQERTIRRKIADLEDERAAVEAKATAQVREGTQTRRRIEDLTELRKRIADLPAIWQVATIEERRSMLRLAIARVELVPRPAGNRRGKGQPRGRRLVIVWADWLS